jgi:hypothetical protein
LSDEDKDLPAVPSNIDTGLKRALDAMREAMQRMMGKRGDGGRAAVLWDDLAQGGIADKRGNLTVGDYVAKAIVDAGGLGGVISTDPDLTKPPTPVGLEVTAGTASILIEFDAPIYSAGHGHKQTNIYATKQASSDTTPYTINDAVRVDIAPGAMNVIALPGDLGIKWRVWIRFESVDGVESDPAGGVNGAVSTIGDGTASGTTLAKAVMIDDAKVANLSAAKLKVGNGTIGGILKSSNYTSGTLGWTVRPDGYAEFSNVVVRGSVYANTGEFSATVRMGAASSFSVGNGLWQGLSGTSYVWRVGIPGGNRAQWDGTTFQIYTNGSSTPLLSAGGINAAAGQLVINTPGLTLDGSGNATFAGALNAATGTFAGQLAAGTVNAAAFEAITVGPYASNGTFNTTVPAKRSGWVGLACRMTIQDGGGGGGGGYACGAPNDNPASSGAGGGSGKRRIIQVEGLTEGQTVRVVVGRGGDGGSPDTSNSGSGHGGNGQTGGASSVTINSAGYSTGSGQGGIGGEGGSNYKAYNRLQTNGGTGGNSGVNGISGIKQYLTIDLGDGPINQEDYSACICPGGAGGSSDYQGGGSGGYAWIYPTRWDAGGSGGYGSGGGGGAANAFEPDNGYANWGGRGGNGYVMLEFYDPYSVVTNGRYSNLIVWLDSRLGTVPTAAR